MRVDLRCWIAGIRRRFGLAPLRYHARGQRAAPRRLAFESLMPRHLLAADLVVAGFLDEGNRSSDAPPPHGLLTGEAEPPVSAAAAESVADLAGAPVWHNAANPADVNDDGLITPVDALIVANFLHVHGPGPVASLPATDGPHIYPDVNGDGEVTVADFD